MNNYYVKYSFLAILLVLTQVLILNNILFLGFLNPIVYIIFVFVYPIKKNKTSLLLFSFFLGLAIDFFSNSGGSNTAAILFIAYFRLTVLDLIQNNIEFDYLLFNIKKLNFTQLSIYVFIMTLIHHFILFYLEHYSLNRIVYILTNTFYTSIFTSIIIGFSLSLFVKNNNS